MLPAKPTRAFIAYDFALNTGTDFLNTLEHAKSTQPPALDLHYPGDDGEAKEQGTIWGRLVKEQIDQAERVIAFVDLPNANVGFEIGYACGVGRRVGVYRYKDFVHPWMTEPPLRGCFRHRAKDAAAIHAACLSDNLLVIPGQSFGGTGVTVLCPSESVAILAQVEPSWGWKTPPLSGWALDATLPRQLADTGLVIWIITPHGRGDAERDGTENAALSILAGYAEARPEIELRVFIHTQARGVADLEDRSQRFSTNGQLKKHLEALAAEWATKVADRKRIAPTPSAKPVGQTFTSRPEALPPHPEDPFVAMGGFFIGREAELGVAADSVEGLMNRFRSGSTSTGAQGLRLIWAHGFGGMGKSWYLHRIRLHAEARYPEICSLVVDWDKAEWLAPLAGIPRVAAELFDLLAIRLAQRLGVEVAEAYWLAADRVAASKDEHKRVMDLFESQLQLAITDENPRIDSHFLQELEARELWEKDLAKRARRLNMIRRDPVRHRDIFGAWCLKRGETDSAVVCPNRKRADGLREALRMAMKKRPLLLLLDTCEVLDDDLDGWLRELLAPLFRESTPLLVLVGSRLRPDLHQPNGSRRGWRNEIPATALNPYDFGEGRRFTVPEIEGALAELARPLSGDHAAIAEALHRVTLGIPLAVRALLDLHEAGDVLLESLTAPDEDDVPLSESEQVRVVIEQVAARFLLNLQDRPEREEDLRDIIALALLPAYDSVVLAAFWTGKAPVARIRELAARYSLLADGDLHPTVRRYLRRYWRDDANRPEVFRAVLAELANAAQGVHGARLPADFGQEIAWRTMELNFRSWTEGDGVVDDLARALCVARAHEVDGQVMEQLLAELPLAAPIHDAARNLWHRDEDERPTDAEVVPWLRGQCDASLWSEEEQAALSLLEGITSANLSNSPDEALAALAALEKAFARFGLERLPRQSEFGGAYFDCGYALDPLNPADPGSAWVNDSTMGYERAIALRYLESVARNNVANLYQDYLRKFERAEEEYRAAIALDPKNAVPHNGLGGLYRDHLRKPERAEEEYRAAISLDPTSAYPHNGLGNLYQEDLGKPKQAEEEYRAAISLDPKSAYPHNGLGNLYQNHLGNPEQAEEEYRAAIALNPKFAAPHVGLGHLYQSHLERPEQAEEEYRAAIALNPKFASPRVGLGMLFENLGRWAEATMEFQEANQLSTRNAGGARGLAWIALKTRGDSAEARMWLEKAVEAEPNHPGTPLTALGVEVWAGRDWPSVVSQFTSWVKDLPERWKVSPWSNRSRLAALLRKAHSAGELEGFAGALRASADREWWRPWAEAVDAFLAQRDLSSAENGKAAEIFRLLKE